VNAPAPPAFRDDLLDPEFLAWFAEHATDEERARFGPQLRELVDAQRYNWRSVARPDQLAPEGDWLIWLILAGRGWGKTKTGAEWTHEKAEENPGCQIALVGASLDDVRDTMVEGESGLLSRPPDSALRGGSRETAWNRSMCELYMANGTNSRASARNARTSSAVLSIISPG
jgi:phage terminase large subunit-like protein